MSFLTTDVQMALNPRLDGEQTASIFQTMKVERVVRVPADPQEIVIRPDFRIAYVFCDQAKLVVAINLSEEKIEKFIDVGADEDLGASG